MRMKSFNKEPTQTKHYDVCLHKTMKIVEDLMQKCKTAITHFKTTQDLSCRSKCVIEKTLKCNNLVKTVSIYIKIKRQSLQPKY